MGDNVRAKHKCEFAFCWPNMLDLCCANVTKYLCTRLVNIKTSCYLTHTVIAQRFHKYFMDDFINIVLRAPLRNIASTCLIIRGPLCTYALRQHWLPTLGMERLNCLIIALYKLRCVLVIMWCALVIMLCDFVMMWCVFVIMWVAFVIMWLILSLWGVLLPLYGVLLSLSDVLLSCAFVIMWCSFVIL